MSRLRPIRIGTRASRLALWQARQVETQLRTAFPHRHIELVEISSHGDSDQSTPLVEMGNVGIFTKRLEEALLRNEVDIAVHSLKDMPTALPPGLQLAAFIERADPRDALISKGARSIAELPDGATVATGSIRRRAQVRARRPDIAFSEIRGNIETRLRKFHDSSWDAMILAGAGLSRLGLDEQITALIEPEEVLHAVGQGIMTVECREADYETAELVAGLTHPPAEWAALAERALMRRLEGGCQVPIGAHAETVDGTLTLEAAVVSLDGERVIRDQAGDAVQSRDQARERADALGRELADRLIAQGAEAILAEIRHPRSEP